MIYFDNAATGGFKPNSVIENSVNAIKYLSANPGRSCHRLALTGLDIMLKTREIAAKMFNTTPEKVIFTKNCTEGLNMAIYGSVKKGGHIITTCFEHNSVLRPLWFLKDLGLIELSIIDCNPVNAFEKISQAIKNNTYMVACSSASNVTGDIFPVAEIGKICKKHGLLFLCDGAQGGGHIRFDLKNDNIDFLSLSGHKGLFGIMGSGLLIINENSDLTPVILGGTGTDSNLLTAPLSYPERLEAGTVNLPAICALKEGLKYVDNNLEKIGEILYSFSELLINKLRELPDIEVFSPINKIGIVSFRVKNKNSDEIADTLNKNYDIAVRSGLFCAPLIHKYLGTEKDGLIRVSLSVFNSTKEIMIFIKALKEII